MSSYHQMGHDSWNLVAADNLDLFSGVILSPVNNAPTEMQTRIEALANRAALDVVLDPQFYVPRSVRGQLPQWPYFNADCDTTDLTDSQWWAQRCRLLVEAAERLGVTSICSPAILPRVFDSNYYEWTIACGHQLQEATRRISASVLLTVVASMRELGTPGYADRLASQLTKTDIDRVYLVFSDDLSPREQWIDPSALSGALTLIRALESAGSKVLVGYSGLDVMLWKCAGATSVATGKYFNLRRFGPGRWEDNLTEGRVVEYWTEPSLITWLRENDVSLLLRRAPELISHEGNPFSQQILGQLGQSPRIAWLALSWKQYLWWFSRLEASITARPALVPEILGRADRNWGAIETGRIYLFDRTNTGAWIRAWLNALAEC